MRGFLSEGTFRPFRRAKAVARLVWRGRGLCLFSFIGGENRRLSWKGLNLSGLGLRMYLEETKGTREQESRDQGDKGKRERGNKKTQSSSAGSGGFLVPLFPRSLLLADARQLFADHGGDDAVGAHCRCALPACACAPRSRGRCGRRRGPADARARLQGRGRRLRARRRTPPCLRWPRTPGRGRAARRPIAPRAAPGRWLSSIAMPTSEECAISFNVEARPPRVGSRMAWTAAPAASRTSAIMPFSAAQSDRIWLSNSRPSRTLMMAMPWSPMVPETMIASPGFARCGPT